MSTIKLNSVHCERLQDSVTSDEIEVRIAGVKVGGPYGIHKRQTVQLGGITRTFTGAVTVQLVELDGNNTPDNLGQAVISDEPVTGVSRNFDAAEHAFYTLNYTVT